MEDTYFPEISESDYESLRAIIHELIPTYKEWLHYITGRVAHWSKTHNVIRVEVKPDGLSEYLRKSGEVANLNSLYMAAGFFGKSPGAPHST